MNRSSCDDMPLTHVHEEPRIEKQQQKKKKAVDTYQKTKGKTKLGVVLSIIIMVVGIASSLFGILKEVGITETTVEPEYYSEDYSPYDYVDKVHPQDGEYAEYTFTSGEYIVGIHLPEGDYQAIVDDGFDTVQVKDNENGIYLYEYQEKSGGNYLNDLRLFNGAIVTISTRTKIELQSGNAQYQNMGIMLENPLKDSFVLNAGDEAVAGADFAAGIYNLYAASDYTYVYMNSRDEYGEIQECYTGLEIGEESERGVLYQNVVIHEGAAIWCEEGDVELIPANVIGDMDYSRYYW